MRPPRETAIHFIVCEEGNIHVDVDYIGNVEELAQLIAAITTGELSDLVMGTIEEDHPDDVEKIGEAVGEILQSVGSENEDEPIVQPIHAIKHMMTMYHVNDDE
jgi:hypothetical protein